MTTDCYSANPLQVFVLDVARGIVTPVSLEAAQYCEHMDGLIDAAYDDGDPVLAATYLKVRDTRLMEMASTVNIGRRHETINQFTEEG